MTPTHPTSDPAEVSTHRMSGERDDVREVTENGDR